MYVCMYVFRVEFLSNLVRRSGQLFATLRETIATRYSSLASGPRSVCMYVQYVCSVCMTGMYVCMYVWQSPRRRLRTIPRRWLRHPLHPLR